MTSASVLSDSFTSVLGFSEGKTYQFSRMGIANLFVEFGIDNFLYIFSIVIALNCEEVEGNKLRRANSFNVL